MRRSWFISLAVVALPALAESPSLARVVSSEGATVTLEVVSGAVVNGDQLDVFVDGKQSTVTVKLPSSVDLMMKGDTLKGVALVGVTVTPGTLVTTKGAFASANAARQAFAGGAPVAPPSAEPALKESTAGCVFTSEELSRALGFKVGAGKGTESAFSGGRSLTCQWAELKGLRFVVVNRQLLSGDAETNRLALRKMLAGRLEDVPRDPDHAAWQVDQGDLTDVTLHYFRDNVGTEVRVSGFDRKNRAVADELRRRVLTLRRP